ncbi:MAG: hypothetical protein QM762_05005 [Chryseolinea sp.]
MKVQFFCLLALLASISTLFGEVRNGYERDINGAYSSLRRLNSLMLASEHELSLFQKIEIRSKIDQLVRHILYYELTEQLLIKFKAISPQLYAAVDSVKSITGEPVVVYVQFVPSQNMPYHALGTTNIAQCEGNEHVYHSEFGNNTVSVKIASVNKALLLLAHEFGHVIYQVPNFGNIHEVLLRELSE